jgi:hypothetical protein
VAQNKQIADAAEVIVGLIAYGLLFTATIRQNRKNRAVVLGVVTAEVFAGFLFYAYLVEKHAPTWLLATVEALIILTGLSILALVVRDVFRWATGKREPAAQGKDQSADSGLGSQ